MLTSFTFARGLAQTFRATRVLCNRCPLVRNLDRQLGNQFACHVEMCDTVCVKQHLLTKLDGVIATYMSAKPSFRYGLNDYLSVGDISKV